MDYNYNRIFDEIKQLINKSALLWVAFMAGTSLLIGVLCVTGILPASALWSFLWIVPVGLSLGFVVRYYHKKAELLAKKQQISMMAYHAKKVMENLQQQFPDTFISDCKIKMHYLSKHGIDIDAAMARLGNNVETYNELVMTFLRESDKREDTLYDLMQAETLIQYAQSAHTLRVKANELGIINLTDTAFFHEIEAYAGGLDIIRDNWKKLSFELDEAYNILSEYIKSIGIKDDAVDKEGNHITFKMWAEQLQEAFNALEIYDTKKARTILSELIKFQIDSDITTTLQGIITNIDEMMAN